MTTATVYETLKIHIIEAKELRGESPAQIRTFCKLKLGNEYVFETVVRGKETNPYYNETFDCDFQEPFLLGNNLSVVVFEKAAHKDKVLGKVNLRKEDLKDYKGDNWFPLKPAENRFEAEGSIHIELSFMQVLQTEPFSPPSTGVKQQLVVKLIEAKNLACTNIKNCTPSACISLLKGAGKKPTKFKCPPKKGTNCPKFEYQCQFPYDSDTTNPVSHYSPEHVPDYQLEITLFQEEQKNISSSSEFLGEVRLKLSDVPQTKHDAWYALQPRKDISDSGGHLRLNIDYNKHQILPSEAYKEFERVLIQNQDLAYHLFSADDERKRITRPLLRIMYKNSKIVDLIKHFATMETNSIDEVSSIWRSDSVLSKCVGELMFVAGRRYLSATIKCVIDRIYNDHKYCEIDPLKAKSEKEIQSSNQLLRNYVIDIMDAILSSGKNFPSVVSQVLSDLRDLAVNKFSNNNLEDLQNQIVSSFVFLRFFAPAIVNPKLFEIRSDTPDCMTGRTLTLISKSIQSLGNLVCTRRKNSVAFKEDFMANFLNDLLNEHPKYLTLVKDFLGTVCTVPKDLQGNNSSNDTVLKEGILNKKSRGNTLFRLSFYSRFFSLTPRSFRYRRGNGKMQEIRLLDILAIEDLSEASFGKKNMLQIVYGGTSIVKLYLQAKNRKERDDWKKVLHLATSCNTNRLVHYHPGITRKGR
ncbi:DgyrCDS9043 [Dimorphilus gyrociliatus]|nr:DgyrCDS9043 [Dimorphilus gyrociliatus]